MKSIHQSLRIALIGIWSVLLIFAVIWFIEPQWLKNISQQGKIVEASENKQKGDELLRQRDFKAAYSAYTYAHKILPDMESAQIGQAIALQYMGKYSQALNIYQKLLAEGADKPWEIYVNLAGIYEKKRDKQKTIEALQNAITSSPDPFDGYVRLARLYFTNQEWQNALKYYKLAFDNKPDIINDYLASLKTEKKIYAKDTDISQQIQGYINEGFSEQQKSLYYSDAYKKQLEEDPLIARIYNDAGYCYAMAGDFDTAVSFFRSAVKLQPANSEFQQNLTRAENELSK